MVLAGLLIYAFAGAVRLTRPITDFYVAGAKVPAIYNGMGIAAGFVAVLAYPALAGALAPGWRGAPLILGGGAGGLVLGGLLLAPYLRKFGGYTVPDFLGERFSSATLRPLAVVAVFLCSFPALAALLVCLAVIITRIFAIDLAAGIGAAVAMLLLCTFMGGMRSGFAHRNRAICRAACRLGCGARDPALAAWRRLLGSRRQCAVGCAGEAEARCARSAGSGQPSGAGVLPRGWDGGAAASRDAWLHRALGRGGAHLVSVSPCRLPGWCFSRHPPTPHCSAERSCLREMCRRRS